MMPMQPGVSGAGAAGKGPLPSTWSDHAVNISLDFLGPGAQPPKPNQPSLKTLQQGEEEGTEWAHALATQLFYVERRGRDSGVARVFKSLTEKYWSLTSAHHL